LSAEEYDTNKKGYCSIIGQWGI